MGDVIDFPFGKPAEDLEGELHKVKEATEKYLGSATLEVLEKELSKFLVGSYAHQNVVRSIHDEYKRRGWLPKFHDYVRKNWEGMDNNTRDHEYHLFSGNPEVYTETHDTGSGFVPDSPETIKEKAEILKDIEDKHGIPNTLSKRVGDRKYLEEASGVVEKPDKDFLMTLFKFAWWAIGMILLHRVWEIFNR